MTVLFSTFVEFSAALLGGAKSVRYAAPNPHIQKASGGQDDQQGGVSIHNGGDE